MRCLLVQPEDDPLSGTWARGRWKRVVDLGHARPSTYEAWAEALGCKVEVYPRLETQDFTKLRAMYSSGLGYVVDKFGLDWWDLLCVRWQEQIIDSVLATRFMANADDNAEIFVRSKRHARVLGALAHERVHQIPSSASRVQDRLTRLRRLTVGQVLEIAGDKYDGNYRWRRYVAPPKANCHEPIVLVPSGYGNASRTACLLASNLPQQEFLLVATRQSAWIETVPRNVTRTRLASYAVGNSDPGELQYLLARWEKLREALREQDGFALLCNSGCFDNFGSYLREGLAVRDCWTTVFRHEPVNAVLCADEKNPYTRIPIQLARKRGVTTVSCHHGALDGRYLFTDICADQFLSKSDMEWDYLVNTCHMPQEVVRGAGPSRVPIKTGETNRRGDSIVFFSEPYEALNGRTPEVYAEVLPGLSRLGTQYGRELIVKLHPFQSLRESRKIADEVLPREDRSRLRFVAGPLSEELIRQAWFCVTVTSSAAVDCAMRGVPAFLCLWLDQYGFRYGEQFVKFGAAMPLRGVEEIAKIPSRLEHFDGTKAEGFSRNVEPELLTQMLFSNAAWRTDKEEAGTERLWA